jgi:hypothetical protein
MDWNHAWGAAPGNLIPRFVLGLRPLSAGFEQILIQPQLGRTLTYAQGVVPTIRGPVSISASNAPGNFQLLLNIPGNVTATVMLPAPGSTNPVVLVDGDNSSGTLSNNWLILTNIGAGEHTFSLNRKFAPASPTFYSKRPASSSGATATNPVIAEPATASRAAGGEAVD